MAALACSRRCRYEVVSVHATASIEDSAMTPVRSVTAARSRLRPRWPPRRPRMLQSCCFPAAAVDSLIATGVVSRRSAVRYVFDTHTTS